MMNVKNLSLVALVVSAFFALPAAAVCVDNQPTNPENDCDFDGQTVGAGDCNDTDNTIKLGGTEICDGKDNDCDLQTDEGFDADADGFKRCVDSCVASCDCDDGNNSIHPGAAEQCDGVDQDCDAVPDQSENISRSCYDGPAGTAGVGECRNGSQVCVGATFGTCNNDVLPATEICDGKNNDCDGATDEDFDDDADGAKECVGACNVAGCDCNDQDSTVRPGRTETCDGVDEDCDGQTDEQANGSPITQQCYDAADLIAGGTAGTGQCTRGSQTCNAAPNSNVASFGTCTGEGIGAAESCDGADNDCDGQTDDGLTVDADTDAAPSCASTCLRPPFSASNCDCDDTRANVGSNDADVCDGLDNDCNGSIDLAANGNAITRSCYDAADLIAGGTAGRGVCTNGSQTCNAAAGSGTASFGTCTGEGIGQAEQCNVLDDDCDGTVNDGVIDDSDADGTPQCGSSCLLPPFDGPLACDCDDTRNDVEPGRNEVCNGRDDDCDGIIDEGFDNDGDGFLSCLACNFGNCDCNDNDNSINPAATEDCGPVDRDCIGGAFNGFADNDSDGVPGCFAGECNDTLPLGNRQHAQYGNVAGVPEQCDGLDNDCNGTVDLQANGNPFVQAGCFDGPGTPGFGPCHSGSRTCNATLGSGTASFGACTGQVVGTNDPALSEATCDGIDGDCDNVVDDGFDADGDGSTTCGGDCNDGVPGIHPGAPEDCDALDSDCDGDFADVAPRLCFEGPNVTDDTFEGLCPGPGCQPKGECLPGLQTCVVTANVGVFSACTDPVLPANDPALDETTCDFLDDDCDGVVDDGDFDLDDDGFTTCGGDCEDNDAAINPAALEVCDNVDNNCDVTVDGAQTECYDGAAGTAGVGVCRAGTSACQNGVPQGECVGQVVPAAEDCNLADDDCDGLVDEDFDGDGDGSPDCARCPTLNASQCDCDDADAFNHPGAREVCDCQDNNCTGSVDEGSVCTGAPCHDFDRDGVSNCTGDCDDNASLVNVNQPERFGNGIDDDCDGQIDEDVDEDLDGFTTAQGDCDDRFGEIHPGADERCDLFDNNCNGQIDEGFDLDGDGARSCVGDCDDNDNTRSPFRKEICGNGIDDNCNGAIDENDDADTDGVTTCDGDCNDFNASVHGADADTAAAEEVCDGQDNDCNGQTDEGFDADNDRVATCFGDCADDDAARGPNKLEITDNDIDDDCDGIVDEVDLDNDGDGFTGACGDCDDANAAINPHAEEACDRVDNNCDAIVDAEIGNANLCSACQDADADGFTNCDGDCNDLSDAIYPGAVEVCDLLDNDCDRVVDLDKDGLRVCVDAGEGEGEGEGDVVAEGEGEGGNGNGDEPPTLDVGCSCNDAGPEGAIVFALVPLLLLRRRRRGLRVASMLGGLLAAFVVSGCQAVTVEGVINDDGDVVAGEGEGTEGEGEEGEGDVSVGEGEGDSGSVCDDVVIPPTIDLPLTQVPVALLDGVVPTPLTALPAVVFDGDNDLAAAAFVRTLPANIPDDGDDIALAAAALDIDTVGLGGVVGSPAIVSRIEQSRRRFTGDQGGAVATFRMSLAGLTTTYALRDRVLQTLTDADPAQLSDLPAPPVGSTVTDEVALQLFTRVVRRSGSVFTIGVVAIAPVESLDVTGARLNDLTNGTLVGPPGLVLRGGCEQKTFPTLQADFIFVIDNSGSMQEEQAALVAAADSFYAALVTSGLDFRLAVITTDSDVLRGSGFTTDLDVFKQSLRVGIAGNGFEMGLEFAKRAVEHARTSTIAERALREDAAPIIVVLSDEEAENLGPVSGYADFFLEQGGVVSGIVGPLPNGCQLVGLGSAVAGRSYIDVANATGGTSGSICNPNLSETITDILLAAAGAASRSPLERIPVSSTLLIEADGQRYDRSREDGFDYERGANTILFFGSQPGGGTPVDVGYAFFTNIGG